jgi:hypothetical protein
MYLQIQPAFLAMSRKTYNAWLNAHLKMLHGIAGAISECCDNAKQIVRPIMIRNTTNVTSPLASCAEADRHPIVSEGGGFGFVIFHLSILAEKHPDFDGEANHVWVN